MATSVWCDFTVLDEGFELTDLALTSKGNTDKALTKLEFQD
jgi:hypothetical protein